MFDVPFYADIPRPPSPPATAEDHRHFDLRAHPPDCAWCGDCHAWCCCCPCGQPAKRVRILPGDWSCVRCRGLNWSFVYRYVPGKIGQQCLPDECGRCELKRISVQDYSRLGGQPA